MPTLEQIQAKMLKLQTQADALIAKGAQAALDQIRRIMLEHGLTSEDIEAKAKAKRDAKPTNEVAPKLKRKVAATAKEPKWPKYPTSIPKRERPGPDVGARPRGLLPLRTAASS